MSVYVIFSENKSTGDIKTKKDMFGDDMLYYSEAEAIREVNANNDLLTSNGRTAKRKYFYEEVTDHA